MDGLPFIFPRSMTFLYVRQTVFRKKSDTLDPNFLQGMPCYGNQTKALI